MHPLSVFPQLFTWSLAAPLLLRLAVGIAGIAAGRSRRTKSYPWMAFAYYAASIFIIAGLYTQIAVLVGLAILGFDYYTDKAASPISREKMVLYMLVKIILLSLLLTGPGFLAFDLPL